MNVCVLVLLLEFTIFNLIQHILHQKLVPHQISARLLSEKNICQWINDKNSVSEMMTSQWYNDKNSNMMAIISSWQGIDLYC